ncbi:MAG: hypothetical protein ABJK64_01180 [Paraglaciecola sp.]|uniref:hypothetical protein n=1 Tax=Paraglaciecola sp. TaxID=1920173 RepID=UPI003299DACF
MEDCKSALVEYFKEELPKLVDSYTWKIPNIEGFSKSAEKGYLANVELKKYFNRMWNGSNTEGKLKLAKIIVSDWGGVKANPHNTLYASPLLSDYFLYLCNFSILVEKRS